jgi:oligopeptide transport system ATP-binding protein
VAAPLVELDGWSVMFRGHDAEVAAVLDVGLALERGERLGIVGESGSGKTQLSLSLIGLLADNGRSLGRMRFDGTDLDAVDREARRALCGKRVAMVFQDPMTALNPFLTIERQLTEGPMVHRGLSRDEARSRAIDMLRRVQIPEPEKRLARYPHELSGGMRQRVMIAIALLAEPDLLIADEPTTALDVTVQAQILALIDALCREQGTALILITHDLGVIARLVDRVAVMYAGRIVEVGPAEALFANPAHPYTRGLLASLPRMDRPRTVGALLPAIAGQPPSPQRRPNGCAFYPRCPEAGDRCRDERPAPRPRGPLLAACHLVEAA